MMDATKYHIGYYPPPEAPGHMYDWMKKDHIEKAPIWCSVDLRDGNQSLMIPMNLEEKLEFFKLLCKIGFKEIEVGFPAASDTEYQFLRTLIEQDLIPEDVTVQVLTQAREHIIEKTFAALEGCRRAIVHLYNSTSVAQREQVFRKSKEEIIGIAVEGAELFRRHAEKFPGDLRFEYSPESFTGTEPEFALEICNAVLDVWKPTPEKKVIINLPVTVELSMPHVYANQVEYMCGNLKYRDSVIVSLHPHNDRGCAVADTEMALLAGAERVEGTLFGNGERTGNVDIITLALNMYSQGVEPGLDFTNLPAVTEQYEEVTRMHVGERQPYSGALVFAAFSGSHQDAIAKGMKFREETGRTVWDVPYLPIDPKDVGREYDSDVIRINSQSGKGGVGYVLEHAYGIKLPMRMKEAMSYAVKHVSDVEHRELKAPEIFEVFGKKFLTPRAHFDLGEVHYRQENGITAIVEIVEGEKKTVVEATGNGRLDAVSNALKKHFGVQYNLTGYEQHALSSGSFAQAISYLGVESRERVFWGAGENSDITRSSVQALVSALNNLLDA